MICDPENLADDFFLLRDGPIWVTSDHALWSGISGWLDSSRGYIRHHWVLASQTSFHQEVSETLSWQHQFGSRAWNGNLDALNDGAQNWPLKTAERVLISIDNAQNLKAWFGGKTHNVWDILQNAARLQLLFGVGVLVLAHTTSDGEATRWAKAAGVSKLTRKSFPGAHFAKSTLTT